MTKDVWAVDYTRPMSLNGWNYVEGNPINRIDPSGKWYCQSGFIPLTSDCVDWVNGALSQLEHSGNTGKNLVEFFYARDDVLDALSTVRDILVCIPLPIPSGIKIYFESRTPSWLGALAYTIWPDQIHINANIPGYSGSAPSSQAVVTFGHEISHLAQGIASVSVQGEVLAATLSYFLENDLGESHRADDNFIIDNQLDPWLITDLQKFDDVPQFDLPFPLMIGFGITSNWLSNWGITLPYLPSLPPQPSPQPPPTPPPGTPIPLGTPAPL